MDRQPDFWPDFFDQYGHMEPQLIVAALDREMTLEMGVAARLHAKMDSVLFAAHRTLSRGAALEATTSTAQLIREVRLMLQSGSLPAEALSCATAALKAAKDANRQRNRLLHDLWEVVLDDDHESIEDTVGRLRLDRVASFSVGHAEPRRTEMAALHECTSALSGVYYRLLGIVLLVRVLRSGGGTEDEHYEDLLRLINGPT